jgi:hypothetical protein
LATAQNANKIPLEQVKHVNRWIATGNQRETHGLESFLFNFGMTEVVDQTFLTALPDDKHSKSFVLSEDADELGINADSSNDFDYRSVSNDDLEEEKVIEGVETPEIPAPTTTIIQSLDSGHQQETM